MQYYVNKICLFLNTLEVNSVEGAILDVHIFSSFEVYFRLSIVHICNVYK